MKFISLRLTLALLALLFPSTLLAKKEAPAVTANHQVTTAEYALFLNAVAVTDPCGLYDEKMGREERLEEQNDTGCGLIIRSGEPGNYHYTSIPGAENKAITYVTSRNTEQYWDWLGTTDVTCTTQNTIASEIDPELAASIFNSNTRIDPTSPAQYLMQYYPLGTLCAGLIFFSTASSNVPRERVSAIEEYDDDQGQPSNYLISQESPNHLLHEQQETTGQIAAFSNFKNIKATIEHAHKLQRERADIVSKLERVGTPSTHLGEAGRRILQGISRPLLLCGGITGLSCLYWASTHGWAVDVASTLGGPLLQPYAETIGYVAATVPIVGTIIYPEIRRALAPLLAFISSQPSSINTDFREARVALNRFWKARSVHKNLIPQLARARETEMKFYTDFLSHRYGTSSQTSSCSSGLKTLTSMAQAHGFIEESFLRKNHLRRDQLTADQTAQILTNADAFATYLLNHQEHQNKALPEAFEAYETQRKTEALATYQSLIANSDASDPLHEAWRKASNKTFLCLGHTTIALAPFVLWIYFPDLSSYIGPQLNLVVNWMAPFYVEPIITKTITLGRRGMNTIYETLPASAQASLTRAGDHFSFMNQFALSASHEADEETHSKARFLKIRTAFHEASIAFRRYYEIKAAQRNLEEANSTL